MVHWRLIRYSTTAMTKTTTKPAKAAPAKSAAKPAAKAAATKPAATKPAGAKPAATKAAPAKTATPKVSAAKRREESAPKLTVNPFIDVDFYARMRDYTERDAAFIKELKAIAECGAGKKSPDPRHAPSLDTLRGIVKKGLSFGAMLDRMAEGKEKALWEAWMSTFGFEIRAVNYAPTGARNACLVLDLGATSPAHAMFAKEGIQNWRSLAADDCAVVRSDKATETSALKVFAVFYLDPA